MMRSVLVLLLPLAHLLFAGASLKPGDFPLLSNRSRAAARAMLLAKDVRKGRTEIILGCSTRDRSTPHATEWRDDAKGERRARVISIPEGMTLERGLRALGDFSEREMARAAELHPEPLNTGTMLMLRR
jgi:hypothetical protein